MVEFSSKKGAKYAKKSQYIDKNSQKFMQKFCEFNLYQFFERKKLYNLRKTISQKGAKMIKLKRVAKKMQFKSIRLARFIRKQFIKPLAHFRKDMANEQCYAKRTREFKPAYKE